ncbi:GDCCVxC domain-containing (seleno)protein [Balneola vulgaris]|uniref:GDCCVxC domain-containing (seleno)protein n=1 Tax=Balneola vulgaris TaxID=287535 RepID=UPI0008FBE724
MKLITETIICCPKCSMDSTETMPTDRCLYFWECPHCFELIKPKQGDCCVFCSYAEHACPPIQNGDCCT